MAFMMFWDILWGLVLGFSLSAVVEAVISKQEIVQLLPDDKIKTIGKALALGTASSSCSYAAVALTRSIIRKGANFTAAMAFQLASTNLVAELAIILALLVGWQFTLAEFLGAPIMVAVMVLLFRAFLRPGLLKSALEQAQKGIRGRMEGHVAMDMSVTEGPLVQRIFSDKGKTAIKAAAMVPLFKEQRRWSEPGIEYLELAPGCKRLMSNRRAGCAEASCRA